MGDLRQRRQLAMGGLAVLLVLIGVFVWDVGDARAAPTALHTQRRAARQQTVSAAMPGRNFAAAKPDSRSAGEAEPMRVVAPAIDEVAEPPPPESAGWIRDLLSDDVRGNAKRAMFELRRAGRSVIRPLRGALRSHDEQQRHLAAIVLRQLDAAPAGRLVDITIGHLGRTYPRDIRITLGASPMHGALRYLVEHARAVRPQLRRGLWNGDERQRFFCAYLLAYAGDGQHLADTCNILTAHLADNHIGGDAMMAAHGLYKLGQRALPFVHGARFGADQQASGLLRIVELDIREPPRTRKALEARRRMHGVTNLYHDPVFQYRPGQTHISSW